MSHLYSAVLLEQSGTIGQALTAGLTLNRKGGHSTLWHGRISGRCGLWGTSSTNGIAPSY